MSLQTWSKNLNYLKSKRGLTQRQIVAKTNKILRREFKEGGIEEITIKRLGSYLEGRAFCPAYMLPVLCKVLRHKNVLALFTEDLDKKHCKTA